MRGIREHVRGNSLVVPGPVERDHASSSEARSIPRTRYSCCGPTFHLIVITMFESSDTAPPLFSTIFFDVPPEVDDPEELAEHAALAVERPLVGVAERVEAGRPRRSRDRRSLKDAVVVSPLAVELRHSASLWVSGGTIELSIGRRRRRRRGWRVGGLRGGDAARVLMLVRMLVTSPIPPSLSNSAGLATSRHTRALPPEAIAMTPRRTLT